MQEELLRMVIEGLESVRVPYMLVGSFASSTYGEPRMTLDIDIVMRLMPGRIEAFCRLFAEAEFYLSRSAVADAVRQGHQFNVLHTSSGNKIDFMMPPANAWGTEAFKRRRKVWLTSELQGYVASPEDVILGKLWYYCEGGSEKHPRDIAGILRGSAEQIDIEYVDFWAAQSGYASQWKAILASRR